MSERVYILLVNWNGWADTRECLESLLQLDYPDFRIVVVDNASTDGSAAALRRWANARCDMQRPVAPGQTATASAPAPFFSECGREAAERGGDAVGDAFLTLVCAPANLGFAGGNNIGLRFALARGDAGYVWLLNNDTVVDPQALSALVERIRARRNAGMCGSSLLFYDRPATVQALGGAYYCPWLAVAWHLGQRRSFVPQSRPERVERLMSYVVGASMLVSMEWLRSVGLMTEDYFLYFEEIDWTLRGGKRFGLAYAPGSLVYHKVGGSIGTRSHPAHKSLTCDYYNIRNRIVFTRRHYPWALPTVYLGLCVEMLLRICCGRLQRAAMILRLMLCGRNPPPLADFEQAR